MAPVRWSATSMERLQPDRPGGGILRSWGGAFLIGVAANHEHNFPLRRMRGVVREQFRSRPATIFLERLRQLPGHAKLPLRNVLRAALQRLENTMRALKKNARHLARPRREDLPLAPPA